MDIYSVCLPPNMWINRNSVCVYVCACVCTSVSLKATGPSHLVTHGHDARPASIPRSTLALHTLCQCFPVTEIKTRNTKSSADRWGRWCAVASAYKYFYSPEVPLRHRYDNKKKLYIVQYTALHMEKIKLQMPQHPPLGSFHKAILAS